HAARFDGGGGFEPPIHVVADVAGDVGVLAAGEDGDDVVPAAGAQVGGADVVAEFGLGADGADGAGVVEAGVPAELPFAAAGGVLGAPGEEGVSEGIGGAGL